MIVKNPEEQQEAVGQCLLHPVDEVVAEDGGCGGEGRADHEPQPHLTDPAAGHRRDRLGGQQRVEDVEAGVLEVGEQPHQNGADVAELRA